MPIDPVIPPDTAAAGQTGHVGAHQQISDALTALVTAVNAIPQPAHSGKATLAGGTVTVSLPAVTASSAIIISRMGPSGAVGHLAVPVVSPGAGFTVTSTSPSENSVIGWLVLG